MNRLSRFFLLLLSVFLLAIYVPKLYWILLEKSQPIIRMNYSPVIRDFLFNGTDYSKTMPVVKYWDRKNNTYTRAEFEQALPLSNYRLLVAKGLLPDSINGDPIDLKELARTNATYRLRSLDFEVDQIPLYPLFESQPERLRLEFNPEYFRCNKRLEFINCYDGKINQAKSKIFTDALLEQGCVFPIQGIYGNPTTRKPFDEGYFLLDKNNQMFHLKMVKGSPYCRNLHLPRNLEIRTILISEKPLKEFYGILVTKSDQIYLIMYDKYRLHKIDLPEYKYFESVLYVRTNLMYRKFQVLNDDLSRMLVLDRNYQPVDSYIIKKHPRNQSASGTIAKIIFPVQIYVRDNARQYINIYYQIGSIYALLLNLLLLVLFILYYRIRNISIAGNLPDFLLILLFGLFAFFSLILFKPIED